MNHDTAATEWQGSGVGCGVCERLDMMRFGLIWPGEEELLIVLLEVEQVLWLVRC